MGPPELQPAPPLALAALFHTLLRMNKLIRVWRAPFLSSPLLASLLALAGGCAPVSNQQLSLLDEGQRAYQSGQYATAVERLSRFIREVPDRSETAQALYIRGMSNAKLEHRPQAYVDLRASLAKSPDEDTRWRAGVVLGTMYFEDGQWDAARRIYASTAARMPAKPPLDFVEFRTGQCLERLGRWQESRTLFEDLVRRFPDGQYSASARRRLELSPKNFAVQCGAFSDQKNAAALLRNLQRAGLPAYTRSDPGAGRVLVLVGRYATFAEAQRGLGQIRTQVPQALIWP